MPTPIKAPAMGESIAEAVVAKWLKAEGDVVAADELIAELETDKVNLEVNAPVGGRLVKIVTPKGATVKVGQVMAELDETVAADAGSSGTREVRKEEAVGAAVVEKSGPAVRKAVAEGAVAPLSGSGRDGRITKQDLRMSGCQDVRGQMEKGMVGQELGVPALPVPSLRPGDGEVAGAAPRQERVPMTRIRKTIAARLKQAQETAALLTTYNEVDLLRVNELRAKFKDSFEKKHGVRLGYMGFFTAAVVAALKEFPALNAEIDGEDIIYKHHYDIGVAVSSERGLVVPVVRNADAKDIAAIERDIGDFGVRAKNGGLKPDELVGATFSITNGGVFGSLMSTPILNYPQVGILGMHAIKDRPVVVEEGGEKKIVIRPMMYLALTYDHRIVDGREAVSFLVRVKEALEEPGRLLLGC